jgi:uncharacterized protein with PIN domain
MSRIRNAYEARFRARLQQLGARRLDQGVRWLLAHAEQLGHCNGIPQTHALMHVYLSLLRRAELRQNRAASLRPGTAPTAAPVVENRVQQTPAPARFLCDAGLGGLARWLRAAGWEADWIPDIEDVELLREAQRWAAVILTTDSMLMERRVLRDGAIPALWLPPTLTMLEQLALVFRELGLSARDPRCMRCGGELRRVEKEAVRERIPPKTWRWVDEYFLCVRCDKLFWHGTHWQRIRTRLRQLDDGRKTL